MRAYLESLKGSPRFSREDERRLWQRMRAGDTAADRTAARELLIRSQLPWAVRLARRYVNSFVPLEDLVGCANLGVIRAVDTFDAARARLTVHVRWQVHSECMRYRNAQHGAPAVQLPTTVTIRTKPAVAAAQARKVCAFDDARHAPLVDPYAARDAALDDQDLLARLAGAIDRLPVRLRRVIEGRLAGHTLSAIGRQMGISRQRVCQIEILAHHAIRATFER